MRTVVLVMVSSMMLLIALLCNLLLTAVGQQEENETKTMRKPTEQAVTIWPSDSTDVFYDAKLKMSKQAMEEIQAYLESEDRCRPGALDNAISQILVDVKPHDYGSWKWRFEDTFGVELHTLLKVTLLIVVIIGIQLLTQISWFVLFQQLFAVCLFVSVIWNWFYLYKVNRIPLESLCKI
uniref:Chloride channel CLIC-like protein 1 n=1 Tax=Oreochromis aureus TaxID=47969 RepID=A0A668W6G9_OREAU